MFKTLTNLMNRAPAFIMPPPYGSEAKPETALDLVNRYNNLVTMATQAGVTAEHVGLRRLEPIRVFHDRTTALSRIQQMEAAIMGAEMNMAETCKWDEGQPAQGARVSYSANGDAAGVVKQAPKAGGTVVLVTWDDGPEQWEPIGRLWPVLSGEMTTEGALANQRVEKELLQTSPGRARLLAHPDAEKIRQEVLMDQERATEAVANPEENEVAAKKAKKEPKVNGESNGHAQRGRKSAFADDMKITVLAESNPKRGKSKEVFAHYRSGMRVATFVEKVGRSVAMSNLRWDVGKGFVSVE